MTAADRAFRELLCKGLVGEAPDRSLFDHMTGEDWETVYHMARRQTVCGVCYDSLCRLPDRLLPSGSLLPRWVARVNAIEMTNVSMRAALSDLVSNLRASGLHPIVQKGLSVARFYLNPESRESGDIDLWLPGEELSAGVNIVTRLGCRPVKHPDGSILFRYQGFAVEFHRTLINVCNPMVSHKIESYARKLCGETGYDNTSIPSPPPCLELLMLNVHIMRHAFGNGIGLRQVCDYVVASKSLRDKYDHREFARLCKMIGISKWTALLNKLSVNYLNADPGDLPPSGSRRKGNLPVAKLYDIIVKGGNFGYYLHNYGSSARNAGKRKLHTLTMFARRSRFAASTSPVEAFWLFFKLLIGQIH